MFRSSFCGRQPLNCTPACPTVNEEKFFLGEMGSDWIFSAIYLAEMGVVVAGPQPISLIDPVSKDGPAPGGGGVCAEMVGANARKAGKDLPAVNTRPTPFLKHVPRHVYA